MKVILDANVLYPAPVRDLLLSLANNICFNQNGQLLLMKNG
jgi:hypothetical protein